MRFWVSTNIYAESLELFEGVAARYREKEVRVNAGKHGKHGDITSDGLEAIVDKACSFETELYNLAIEQFKARYASMGANKRTCCRPRPRGNDPLLLRL